MTKRDYAPESVWKSWNWRSEGDLMMNGAFFVPSGSSIRNIPKKNLITAKPGTYVTRLTRFSGALNFQFIDLTLSTSGAEALQV